MRLPAEKESLGPLGSRSLMLCVPTCIAIGTEESCEKRNREKRGEKAGWLQEPDPSGQEDCCKHGQYVRTPC